MIFSRRIFMKRLLPIALISGTSMDEVSASPVDEKGYSNLVSPHEFKRGNDDTDDTKAINNAIAHCSGSGKTLDLRGGPWTIKKTIDLTNVKSVITDFSGRIYVDPENFESTNKKNFAVIIGNPDSNYKKERSAYNNINGLFFLISKSRNKKLNGLFIKGALLSFDSIRIVGFNGSGCFLSSTWDSTFKSISCELCGNVDDYQINIIPGGDTSNCLSIGRIQSERAFHKCLYIDAIRSTINTIHAERTTVLTTDDGSSLPSGLKYINFAITLSNSVVNQIIHDVYSSTRDLSISESIASDSSSVTINLVNSVLNAGSFSGGVISTNIAIRSQFNSVLCKSWYFEDTGDIQSTSVNSSICNAGITVHKGLSLRDSQFSSVAFGDNARDILIDKCDIDNISIGNGVDKGVLLRASIIPESINHNAEGKKLAQLKSGISFTLENCTLIKR